MQTEKLNIYNLLKLWITNTYKQHLSSVCVLYTFIIKQPLTLAPTGGGITKQHTIHTSNQCRTI